MMKYDYAPAVGGMTGLNIAGDARRAFEAVAAGGIAIIPNNVGYAAVGSSHEALSLIFRTKGRVPTKLNAMIGHDVLHQRLHRTSARGRDIVRAITQTHELPLGVVAPANFDDPMLAQLDPRIIQSSTLQGTLLILLNAGPLHYALSELSHAASLPIFGSSANISMRGTHFRVEEIEPELLEIADVVIDHGVMKYEPYKASSTLLDVENCRIHRRGSCHDSIIWVLRNQFGIEPGWEAG
jgi:tRNA A37 threonylcarbamoyladenosine synthetase subunit TsaC/SUA5/YrdC